MEKWSSKKMMFEKKICRYEENDVPKNLFSKKFNFEKYMFDSPLRRLICHLALAWRPNAQTIVSDYQTGTYFFSDSLKSSVATLNCHRFAITSNKLLLVERKVALFYIRIISLVLLAGNQISI